MSCIIASFAEKRNKDTGKWEEVRDAFTLTKYDAERENKKKGDNPFYWQSYSLFAFLAGVRNYDECEPISEPKGLPNDSEYLNEIENDGWGGDTTRRQNILDDSNHSYSYLTLRELIELKKEKTFRKQRVIQATNMEGLRVSIPFDISLQEEAEGKEVTYRDNLGEMYFTHLEDLKALGEPDDVRIVFWFDN
mgnify:CR=1 FL=1